MWSDDHACCSVRNLDRYPCRQGGPFLQSFHELFTERPLDRGLPFDGRRNSSDDAGTVAETGATIDDDEQIDHDKRGMTWPDH